MPQAAYEDPERNCRGARMSRRTRTSAGLAPFGGVRSTLRAPRREAKIRDHGWNGCESARWGCAIRSGSGRDGGRVEAGGKRGGRTFARGLPVLWTAARWCEVQGLLHQRRLRTLQAAHRELRGRLTEAQQARGAATAADRLSPRAVRGSSQGKLSAAFADIRQSTSKSAVGSLSP